MPDLVLLLVQLKVQHVIPVVSLLAAEKIWLMVSNQMDPTHLTIVLAENRDDGVCLSDYGSMDMIIVRSDFVEETGTRATLAGGGWPHHTHCH